ncbi:hypothetical protein D1AOALGA4SA_6240 [Olavius algarvensis Delta 1 endosymbiont]|nr:hypothetical protein D1AOALGA4SA_6240 [Olavius algarvensis Delta 1 endosymbiont]
MKLILDFRFRVWNFFVRKYSNYFVISGSEEMSRMIPQH